MSCHSSYDVADLQTVNQATTVSRVKFIIKYYLELLCFNPVTPMSHHEQVAPLLPLSTIPANHEDFQTAFLIPIQTYGRRDIVWAKTSCLSYDKPISGSRVMQ